MAVRVAPPYPAPLRNRRTDPHPLVRAAHVMGVLARGEQLTEDLLQRADVRDVTADDRGQRLVEQRLPRRGRLFVTEDRREIGERC